MIRPHSSKQFYEQFKRERKELGAMGQLAAAGDHRSAPVAPKRYLGHYARWLSPYWRSLVFVFVLALLGVGMSMLQPLLTQQIIDRGVLAEGVEIGKRLTRINTLGLLLIGLAIASVTINALRS